MKKTLVFGTSLKLDRYSNLAFNRLLDHNIDTVAFGFKADNIRVELTATKLHDFRNIHTIMLYIGSSRQPEYYGDLLKINPKRVIFNQGTENPNIYKILKDNNIHVEVACTLVLLVTNQY